MRKVDTGVECGLCHEETFRVVKRMAYVEIDCCLRCAGELDMKEALKVMEKSERKQYLKEKSFEWADNLNGKHVIVFWDRNQNISFATSNSEYHAQGTAYRWKNASGGYGQVKIVFNQEENKNVVACYLRSPYFPVKEPEFYCYCLGTEWGLPVEIEDGRCHTFVSWGCRKALQELTEGGD